MVSKAALIVSLEVCQDSRACCGVMGGTGTNTPKDFDSLFGGMDIF
jgi:hypothetical protein